MRHRARLVATMAIIGLVVAACGADSSDSAPTSTTATPAKESATTFPLTVKNCGEDVTFENRPESVLTADPVGIDYMIAAGAVDKITHRAGEGGRELVGDRVAVKDRPVLSAGYETPREVILGSGVDMIFGPYLYSVERADLANDGITLLITSHNCGPDSGVGTREAGLRSIDSVYQDLDLLGRIFGTEAVAAAKTADIKSRIAAVDSSFDPGPFKTAIAFLIGEYDNGDVTGFAKKTLSQEQFDTLGLQNVLTSDEIYVTLSPERFIELDPDIMIIAPIGDKVTSRDQAIAALKGLPGVGDMKAIKEENFVFINADDLNANPRVAEVMEDIAQQINALK